MASLQQAESYGGDLTVKHNIYIPLEEGATRHPDNAAIIAMHQPGDHLANLTSSPKSPNPPLSWTHRELSTAALSVALGLSSRGVRRGGTVVMLFPNRVEWAILMYATIMMGLTFAPLDFGMVTEARSEELKGLLQTLRPDVVVVGDGEGATAVSCSMRTCRLGGTDQRSSMRRRSGQQEDTNYFIGRQSIIRNGCKAHSSISPGCACPERGHARLERILFYRR